MAGLYLSYYLGVASGAAIVLTCTAAFLVTWALTRLRAALAHRGAPLAAEGET